MRPAAPAAPLVRHRRGRPRPVRAGAVRRAGVAGGGPGRHAGLAGDRRALRRDRRLSGRAGRRGDDAHRRHALFPALHLLRHHPDGDVRPQFHPAVRGDRRGGMADHGADRARPDPVDQAEGIHRGGARRRRVAASASSPPHHPQCGGAGGGLCHPDRAGRDPDRKLPVLPGAGHPGAADQLGRADLGRRQPDGDRALAADLSRPCSWR